MIENSLQQERQTMMFSANAAKAINLLLLLLLFLAAIHLPASAAEPKAASWEELVLKGNQYRERGRLPPARKFYENALKILDKQGIDDIRKAMVLHDIAETYRLETNWHQARVNDLASNTIYRREIKAKQLGYEYSSKKSAKVEAGSLKPHCYICHENWKVVPILYGESTGYDGEPPEESDWNFTHKPGGTQIGDQRWYCRDCQQMF